MIEGDRGARGHALSAAAIEVECAGAAGESAVRLCKVSGAGERDGPAPIKRPSGLGQSAVDIVSTCVAVEGSARLSIVSRDVDGAVITVDSAVAKGQVARQIQGAAGI